MFNSNKATKNEVSCNPTELLKMMSFYSAMHSNLPTPVLLKYGGFNIAGLQGIKQAKQGESLVLGHGVHKLAWHEKLSFGICTCFRWVGEVWTRDITAAQHKMHKRLVQSKEGD